MKLSLDIDQLIERPVNDRTICLRIPVEDYEKIKNFHGNVSQVVRGLIAQFVEQLEADQRKWIKK